MLMQKELQRNNKLGCLRPALDLRRRYITEYVLCALTATGEFTLTGVGRNRHAHASGRHWGRPVFKRIKLLCQPIVAWGMLEDRWVRILEPRVLRSCLDLIYAIARLLLLVAPRLQCLRGCRGYFMSWLVTISSSARGSSQTRGS
jgi:hypothetical protein